MDDITEEPLKIIQNITEAVSDKLTKNLKIDDISSIRQNVYRSKQNNTLTLPINLRKTQENLTLQHFTLRIKMNFYL